MRFPHSLHHVSATLACVLAWAASGAPAWAQSGTVQGRVRDDEGSAAFGVVVELERADTVVLGGQTDRLGFFRLSPVPAGTYTLHASGLGYGEAARTVVVAGGTTVDVQLQLPRRAIEMEGISVEAERSRERIRFEQVGGATVHELELKDLKQVPGVAEADPLRAVEVLPGVISTSDFSAAFHVRGGSQDENLILLDGIPVFSPFHLGGFFSVFNADMLDRADLESGGFGAEHGGRVSSVLSMASDPGDGAFKVDAGVSLLASRVAVGGSLPNGAAHALGHQNVHWRVSARRSYFDWLLKPFFDFPYHLDDYQGVLEGWTRSGDRLRVTAYTGADVLDLTRLDPADFPLRVDWHWGNSLVGTQWTHPRKGGGSLDVRANVSRYGTGLTFPDFGDTDFRSAIWQAEGRVDLATRPRSDLRVDVGLSAHRLSYDNLARTGGTEFGRGKGTGSLLGAYAQSSWSRPGSWLVETGVRVDSWSPDPGRSATEASPRVAVKRFFAGGEGAVKLAVGRYTQFVHSLRDEELPLGLDIWVLAGARAPRTVSDQVQLGVEGYPRRDWFASLEAYVRSFDGVVMFNPADDPNDPLDDILGGTGLSWGADLLVRREEGPVNGWLAVSFLKATRTFPDALSAVDPPPDVTYPPIFDRRLDVDLVLRYPLPHGWEGGLRWNVGTGTPYTKALASYEYYSPNFVQFGGRLDWAGARPSSDNLGGYAVYLGPHNGSRYPTYHRLDVSARKTFRKSWGTLVPYVDVLNVYNRKNVLFYFYQYSEDPAVRSGVSMFPLLPSVGLEVHF
ncbi:MAG: TonB-dependent receptor [Gemmatimonadetes bacterium]|nr:TonB-dependent receptor [Gemmatimonadota bacterium]